MSEVWHEEVGKPDPGVPLSDHIPDPPPNSFGDVGENSDAMALALQLYSQSVTQTTSTSNALIDSLQYQLAQSNAKLELIRERVTSLVSGTYMPTPGAILEALWPSQEVVDRWIKRQTGDR